MEEKSSKSIYWVIGIIAVIVIAVLGWMYLGKKGETPIEETPEEQVGVDSIFMVDQKPGRFVNVSEIKFSKKGFAVIHEDQAGAPGKDIGNSNLLSAGTSRNISVTLSRRSIAGESMYGMLHWDNGDGVYNVNTDLPARDKSGNAVQIKFNIREDASEPVDYKL